MSQAQSMARTDVVNPSASTYDTRWTSKTNCICVAACSTPTREAWQHACRHKAAGIIQARSKKVWNAWVPASTHVHAPTSSNVKVRSTEPAELMTWASRFVMLPLQQGSLFCARGRTEVLSRQRVATS